jgi:hypothetical protein
MSLLAGLREQLWWTSQEFSPAHIIIIIIIIMAVHTNTSPGG